MDQPHLLLEGVDSHQSSSYEDESYPPTGCSGDQCFDAEKSIHPNLLRELEPHIAAPPNIDQSTDESLSDTFESQNSSAKAYNIHCTFSNPDFSISTPSTYESRDARSRLSSTFTSSSGENSVNKEVVLDGNSKTEDPAVNPLVCLTCKKRFSGQFNYRQHIHLRGCSTKPIFCAALGCNKSFTSTKDLERHERSSCQSNLKLHPKSFACTCNKKYRRKDDLQRHLKTKNASQSLLEHRCITCSHPRCDCKLVRTR